MNEKIRSFICVEISESARAEIARVQAELRKDPADISWTRPDGFHLTMKFLGDIEPGSVEPIAQVMTEVAGRAAPIGLALDCAGAFPNEKMPRVLWVGLKGELDPLVRLALQLEEALEPMGFKRESKPFRAHVTLGRVRRPRGSDLVARHLVDAEFHCSSFSVSELVLMRSDLRPTGTRYTSLARAGLIA
ncbi:MAG: RNA 2',3'-cyclic phosphodiesterase [Acidobacteria bacterium]|nr:RNA 2',3'-cyclic phosphodiesterase [Acidobacteriota bacterium]